MTETLPDPLLDQPEKVAAGRNARTFLKSLPWHWPFIALLVHLLFGLALATWADPPYRWSIPILAVLLFSSAFPLWLAIPLMALNGRAAVPLRLLIGLGLVLASAWQVASFLRYRDQGHGLTANDLWSGLLEPQTRSFMLSSLFSGQMALFILLTALATLALWLLLRHLNRTSCMIASLAILVGGALVCRFSQSTILPSAAYSFLYGCAKPAMAPWSPIHQGTLLPSMGGNAETDDPNEQVAQTLAMTAEGCEWASPGVEGVIDLRGRYPGRDVLVVLLESHRLSDVAPFGQGAASHLDLCPRLSEFARNSYAFTNYVQPGHGTIWALYSMLSGLTPPTSLSTHQGAGPDTGNRLMGVGPLKHFSTIGYDCDVLVGCEYSFWDLESMLRHAGATGPLDDGERALLAKEPRCMWGFDDDAIYAVALRRMQAPRTSSRPRLQILKTSSNHEPYAFLAKVDRAAYPRNHTGGMRYADEEFGKFIAEIDRLPAERRPIVFVTGDHGHAERLERNPPLYGLSLEAIRVPGFLRLPDGRKARERNGTLISHQDLLALMLLLVDGKGAEGAGPAKFIDRHRRFLSLVQSTGYAVMTPDHYMPTRSGRKPDQVYAIEGLWTVREENDPRVVGEMRRMAGLAKEEHDRLWNIEAE
jgi:hypothetical protein